MAHMVAPYRSTVCCVWLFDPVEMNRPNFDCGDTVDLTDLTCRQDWRTASLLRPGRVEFARSGSVYLRESATSCV